MKSEKNFPLITVIVGMYKGEKYLEECLDSIINQDYTNLEIILVDDGSPDNCGKIADEYAKNDKRIKVIHQLNLGVSTSRNNALDISTGEYICIIDQDDIISKDYINYFYKLIIENDADIALTPSADKFFKQINLDLKKDTIEVWSGEKATIEMLYHKIIIAPWNKMIKHKLIKDNHIKFNPDFFGGEGFAFSIECYQYASKIAVGRKNVYHYRVGDPESGASKFRIETINSSIKAQQYIKSRLIFDSDRVLNSWRFSNWHTYCDCLNIMVGCGVTREYKDVYKELKKVCQKEALCALKAPISFQQKVRGILFKFNPYVASNIINKFRIRKFRKVKSF